MNEQPIRILAIPGSLRRASYNTMLLEAARRLAPSPIEVDVFDGAGQIPLFNQDSEGDLTPGAVLELRARIRAADAILIASPEYNGSITGVLKNLIDWASRPYGHSAFEGKPVSVVGASPSRFGALRSQETTIGVLTSAEATVVGGPHPVKQVFRLVGSEGRIGDAATLSMLRDVLAELSSAVTLDV
ncbi:MAG: NAD(P)H-dependent oxidoreductase [bacterium]|nr:NAD(P)H-dependent oxidoreductase [bacterium]